MAKHKLHPKPDPAKALRAWMEAKEHRSEEFWNEIRGESDRANDYHEAAIFGPNGNLGSLAPRSLVAYALQIISIDELQDMEQIGRIRNAFAHTDKFAAFKVPVIADLCGLLRLSKQVAAGEASFRDQSPRGVYVMTCYELLHYLAQYMEAVGRSKSNPMLSWPWPEPLP